MFREMLEKQKIFIPLKGLHKTYNPTQDMQIGKQPLGKWQVKQYYLEELHTHYLEGGWIGMIIPATYVVIDIDKKQNQDIEEWEKKLEKVIHTYGCPYAKTPNGYHLFFSLAEPMAQSIGRATSAGIIVDYRVGGKGYIVYPYEATPNRMWVRDDVEPESLPYLLYPLAITQPPMFPAEILEDSRHGTLLNVYQYIFGALKNQYRDAIAMFDTIARHFNTIFCEPPQDNNDVNQLIQDVVAYQERATVEKKQIVSDLTTKFILDKNDKLYYYNDDIFHYSLIQIGHSSAIKFAGQFLPKLTDAQLKLFYNQAKLIAEYHDVWKTTHMEEDALYIDCGNEIIKITKDGLQGLASNQIEHYFVDTGSIEYEEDYEFDPLKFLSDTFNTIDELYIPLIYAYIICRFLNVPTPALLFEGAYGSGKTTAARLLSYLIQNYHIQISPKDLLKDEVPLILTQHKAVIVDNITYVNQETSNYLCEFITGGQITKRKLYTDDNLITYKTNAGFILTAIVLDNLMSDLISRTLPIALINSKYKMSEEAIMQYINANRKKFNFYIIRDIARVWLRWDSTYSSSFRFPFFEFVFKFIAREYNKKTIDISNVQEFLWFRQAENMELLSRIHKDQVLPTNRAINKWLLQNKQILEELGLSWEKRRRLLPDGTRPYRWEFKIEGNILEELLEKYGGSR